MDILNLIHATATLSFVSLSQENPACNEMNGHAGNPSIGYEHSMASGCLLHDDSIRGHNTICSDYHNNQDDNVAEDFQDLLRYNLDKVVGQDLDNIPSENIDKMLEQHHDQRLEQPVSGLAKPSGTLRSTLRSFWPR
jgi:hypothetical protein